MKGKKLAKKKKKTMGKVIGTMNLKENRTTFGWIKFGLRCLMYIVSSWMLASLRIAKVAFSYKREYKAELEEAMEKYIEELSEMEEDETW